MSRKILFSIQTILLIAFLANTISMGSAQGSQNDANSGGDAPDQIDSAIPISADVNYTGIIGSQNTNAEGAGDYDDYYSIVPPSTGYVRLYVEILNPQVDGHVKVSILKNGLTVAKETIWNSDVNFTLVAPLTSTNELVIEFSSFSDNVSYLFEAEFNQESYSQNDAGSGADSSLFSPSAVNLNTNYSGFVGNGHVDSDGLLDKSDYYLFDLPAEGYLNVSASNQGVGNYSTVYIDVLTFTLDTIFSDLSASDLGTISFSAPIAGPGTYYLKFSSTDWNISYNFRLGFVSASLPSQNDGGMEGDAPNDFKSAEIIDAESVLVGTVGQGLLETTNGARDEHDYYRIEPSVNGQLDVTFILNESILLNGSSNDLPVFLSLKLYNQSDPFMTRYLWFTVFNSSPLEAGNVLLIGGISYYLDISSFDPNVTYTVRLDFTPFEEPASNTTSTSFQNQSQSSTTEMKSPQSTTDNAGYLLPVSPLIAFIIVRKKKMFMWI